MARSGDALTIGWSSHPGTVTRGAGAHEVARVGSDGAVAVREADGTPVAVGDPTACVGVAQLAQTRRAAAAK
jgi:hypothetical protein